jgi:hypothetical protein
MQEARFEIPKSFEKLEFYLGFSKYLRIFYESKQNELRISGILEFPIFSFLDIKFHMHQLLASF